MRDVTVTVLTVTLEDREDGGLRVYSDVLPGLILSGSDKQAVCQAIAPAICAIFARLGLEGVIVRPAVPISEVLQRRSPRDLDLHVQDQQFVVEVPALAA